MASQLSFRRAMAPVHLAGLILSMLVMGWQMAGTRLPAPVLSTLICGPTRHAGLHDTPPAGDDGLGLLLAGALPAEAGAVPLLPEEPGARCPCGPVRSIAPAEGSPVPAGSGVRSCYEARAPPPRA